MRDWRAYVEGRLGALRMERVAADEVVRELAGHLEECYEALRAQGVSEEEAFSRTCAEAGNWADLRRGVILAKEGRMSDRVKQIWIPSLVTLFVGWGVLALMIWQRMEPILWHPGNPRSSMYMVIYWPWLVMLPAVGAIGAYLSRQARACGWQVYLAGLFPAFAIACVLLVVFPWGLFIETHEGHEFSWFGLVLMTLNWVILPGIALLAGIVLQGWFGQGRHEIAG
ncbi:MAG TPA: permease prefix domain 1-containing protein [Verrucomicrobiae bacterium]|nr:permease prefix domain 1-containing protein [Verrucomicrobiae bacterium]